MTSILRLIPALALALTLTACNPTDAKELKSDVGDIATEAGDLAESAARSAGNATVAAKVNTALSLRKGVHMEGLHIEAEGGTVTVGGHVSTQKEKDLVLTIARETRGVEKLIDELRVEP